MGGCGGSFKTNGEVIIALNLIVFSVINEYLTYQSIIRRKYFGAMSDFKYNFFRFYVIHDGQMLVNILKKSILALHKDATIILVYQFLCKLKTVCLYPYIVRQFLSEFKLGIWMVLNCYYQMEFWLRWDLVKFGLIVFAISRILISCRWLSFKWTVETETISLKRSWLVGCINIIILILF